VTPLPLVRTVGDATLALLQAITGLNVFDSELPADPPKDPDGRVHPYAVFFAGGGRGFGDRLNDVPTDVKWSCRILCVGGDRKRAQWAVDQVRAKLTGARPTGGSRLKELLDEIDLRPELDVIPPRTSGAILYRLHV
jgi:hypothetical protein